ncbi:kinase-like protein, partial [Hymenopellis radicata]
MFSLKRLRAFLRRCHLLSPRPEPVAKAVVQLQPLEQIQTGLRVRHANPISPTSATLGVNSPPQDPPRFLAPPVVNTCATAGSSTAPRHVTTVTGSSFRNGAEAHTASQIAYNDHTYRFAKVLGSGSFGVVKLAFEHKKPVAVKIINRTQYYLDGIPLATGLDPHCGYMSDIQREFDALEVTTSSRSPFLPTVEASFQDHQFVYMVMTYYPMTLSDRLEELTANNEAMAAPELKLKFAELILALEALHQHGCSHFDIKPVNIMISQSGHMVLVDFGIAECGSGIFVTEGGPNGTPGYIAPEAHPVEQSGRTHYSAFTADIYSMGVVFLQMYLAPVDSNDVFFGSGYNIVMGVRDSAHVNHYAADLIQAMMEPEPDRRIPIGRMKNHGFFDDLDWARVLSLSYNPYYVPSVNLKLLSERTVTTVPHKSTAVQLPVPPSGARRTPVVPLPAAQNPTPRPSPLTSISVLSGTQQLSRAGQKATTPAPTQAGGRASMTNKGQSPSQLRKQLAAMQLKQREQPLYPVRPRQQPTPLLFPELVLPKQRQPAVKGREEQGGRDAQATQIVARRRKMSVNRIIPV